MKEVDVKITIAIPDGAPLEMEGRVGLRTTASDTLRTLVEGILGREAGSVQWEAFFYEVANEGMLLAYLSDAGEHEVFHDPSVLKFH